MPDANSALTEKGPWTRFMDMHSGGGSKEAWNYIYIQAPEDEAKVVFYNRFGHSPERVTCTCCGEDYSISEGEDLADATAYDRNCRFDKESRKYVEESRGPGDIGYGTPFIPLAEWIEKPSAGWRGSDSVLLIPAADIDPKEREGSIPEQGYVWVD